MGCFKMVLLIVPLDKPSVFGMIVDWSLFLKCFFQQIMIFSRQDYLIEKDGSSSRYQLYGVINHHGNVGGGHYTANAVPWCVVFGMFRWHSMPYGYQLSKRWYHIINSYKKCFFFFHMPKLIYAEDQLDESGPGPPRSWYLPARKAWSWANGSTLTTPSSARWNSQLTWLEFPNKKIPGLTLESSKVSLMVDVLFWCCSSWNIGWTLCFFFIKKVFGACRKMRS